MGLIRGAVYMKICVYSCYPKVLLGDGIYMNRKNRMFLKEKGIEIYGKPLGRPPKKPKETAAQRYRKRKKAAQRNHVEGKFGQGKRGYGLNNVGARLKDTSESWVNAIIFVMNLTKLMQVAAKYPQFFALFFKWVKNHKLSGKHLNIHTHFFFPQRILQYAA